MDVSPLTTGTLGVTLIAVLPALSVLFYFLKNKKTRPAGSVTEDGRPKVVLYQIGRGPSAPSVSPFPLKLETFLRMANIPYVNDHSAKFSSKGKTPWMEYDGVVVEDSQLCIEHLKQVLGVDMNRGLSPSERAVARALQKMTEENLYWTICAHMFGDDLGPLRAVLPYTGVKLWLTSVLVRRNIQKELWGHGIGRHSSKDIWEIGKADIKALSDFLGEKPFFMGDEPTEGDCAMFGMLAQIVWHMPGSPHESLVKNDHPNLVSYCCRMRDTFWPDWEACITTGKDFKGNN